MKVELINKTNYANIYGIYEGSGRPIGTIECKLAGRDAGTYAYSLTGKYNKRDIKRFYNEYREGR